MTGRTLVLAALAGLVLLVAAGMAAVVLLDRPAGGPSSAPVPSVVASGDAAPVLVPPTFAPNPPVSTARAGEPPPAHAAPAPAVERRLLVKGADAPPEDADPVWAAVDLALRPAALGPDLAGPVARGLAEARGTYRHCFDEEARRLAGRRSSRTPADAQGPAVLVVRLEAVEGRLLVAGTEVASTGTSSTQLVECCRKALQGYEFDAAAVKPPERYRVSLPLM